MIPGIEFSKNHVQVCSEMFEGMTVGLADGSKVVFTCGGFVMWEPSGVCQTSWPGKEPELIARCRKSGGLATPESFHLWMRARGLKSSEIVFDWVGSNLENGTGEPRNHEVTIGGQRWWTQRLRDSSGGLSDRRNLYLEGRFVGVCDSQASAEATIRQRYDDAGFAAAAIATDTNVHIPKIWEVTLRDRDSLSPLRYAKKIGEDTWRAEVVRQGGVPTSKVTFSVGPVEGGKIFNSLAELDDYIARYYAGGKAEPEEPRIPIEWRPLEPGDPASKPDAMRQAKVDGQLWIITDLPGRDPSLKDHVQLYRGADWHCLCRDQATAERIIRSCALEARRAKQDPQTVEPEPLQVNWEVLCRRPGVGDDLVYQAIIGEDVWWAIRQFDVAGKFRGDRVDLFLGGKRLCGAESLATAANGIHNAYIFGEVSRLRDKAPRAVTAIPGPNIFHFHVPG